MLVGYICTSPTEEQWVQEHQYQALQSAGVLAGQIYEDVGCASQRPRPQLESCLQTLQTGDTLITWQLNRLAPGRSTLLEILKDLVHRQIGLRVLEGKGIIINTAHLNLNTVIGVIEALTEFEERTLRDARQEGIASARARGQAFGPKRKMTADIIRQAMSYMANSDMSIAKIAENLGVKRTSLYTYLNGDGSPKPAALRLLEPELSVGDISSDSTNRRNAGE